MQKFSQIIHLKDILKPEQYQPKAHQLSKNNVDKIPTFVNSMEKDYKAQYDLFNNIKTDIFEKLIKKTESEDIIKFQSVINDQNFKVADYLDISIIPVLSKQLKHMIGCYLQIQIKVDPKTKQFFRHPTENKFYYEIIDEIFQKQNIVQMWNCSMKYWEGIDVWKQYTTQLWTIIQNKYRRFAYLVDPEVFYQALIFQNIRQPYQQYQIQNIQSKVFMRTQQKSKQLNYSPFHLFERNSLKRAINQKREMYKQEEYFFFKQTPEMNDYHQLIVQMLTRQQQEMIDQAQQSTKQAAK